MNILLIARTCPVPANDGEKLRVFHLLKVMARSHRVTLVCRVMHAQEARAIDSLRELGVEVVGVSVPPPASHLERLRWVWPFLWSRHPISLCTVLFPAIREELRRLVASRHFDVVQVEHSSLAVYLDDLALPPTTARVVTMHNIDYIRNERVIQNSPWGLRRIYHQLNQMRFRRWELDAVRRFDRAMMMSDVDADILRRDVPDIPIDVVPNGVDCAALQHRLPVGPGPHGERALVFVASMDSEANQDGALYFLDQVLPLIRARRQGVTVWLVGRQPPEMLRARHDGREVFVTGQVDSVEPYYRQAEVAIVPLRSGGGTRLKILEAMALGVPVVSTTVGAEGIELETGRHALLADSPEAFAAAIERLLGDVDLQHGISLAARQQAQERYDWAGIGRIQDKVHRLALASRAADTTRISRPQ